MLCYKKKSKKTRATSAAGLPHEKRQGVPAVLLSRSDVGRINCLGFSLISHFAADRRDGRRGGKPGRHMKARPTGRETQVRLRRFSLLASGTDLKI